MKYMKCPLNECKNGCNCASRYYLLGVAVIAILIIWLGGFNQSLFLAINSIHGVLPDSIWDTFNFIAYPKLFVLPIILMVITFLFKREFTIRVGILIIAYYVIFELLKIVIGEPRPYMVLPLDSFHWVNLYENSGSSAYNSFPSGHTGVATIFIFTLMKLFCQNKLWLRVLLSLLLIMVMFARICTGWHWPLDVLASAVIAYILVKICLCVGKNNVTT